MRAKLPEATFSPTPPVSGARETPEPFRGRSSMQSSSMMTLPVGSEVSCVGAASPAAWLYRPLASEEPTLRLKEAAC